MIAIMFEERLYIIRTGHINYEEKSDKSQQHQAKEDSRFSCQNGNKSGKAGPEQKTDKGKKKTCRVILRNGSGGKN
jgi:hypothetical protein